MNVGDLSVKDFAQRLSSNGVVIRSGYFVTRITSDLPELAAPVRALYRDFPTVSDSSTIDYRVAIKLCPRWRHRWAPHAEFTLDGDPAFRAFERPLALAFLEWGLNRCIYSNAHQFLMFHAAVVDRDGKALLLPGRPGSGKSTLCAGLVSRGWRLLSDELALVRPENHALVPIARAISLKNESIDVVRSFAPSAEFGPSIENTHKGTTIHICPPTESVRQADKSSRAAWIVFPRFMKNARTHLRPLAKAHAFFKIADNAFNYDILGARAFRATCGLIDSSDCYELTYSSLDEAVARLGAL